MLKPVFWRTFAYLIGAILTCHIALAQGQDTALLQHLEKNEKLINRKALLSPFFNGQEHINVIVSLAPSEKAKALSNQSRALAPATFTQNPGNIFYDLQNEEIKKQLNATVKETIDSVITNLDLKNIVVTRKFDYVFGFAATVTAEGLQQLVNINNITDIAEDAVLQEHLAEGIPLINATAPRSTYNGSGLSIAICDTGIDTAHPRLGGSATIFNSKVIGGYDTGDSDTDPRPSLTAGDAHGTSCAGISAGDLGTTGDYIGGVAPGAKLYAIKISTGDTGSATSAAMVAGWEWALTHKNDDASNPIMIISTSFGGGQYFAACDATSSAMTQAAANAVAAGITLFVSSGNEGYCDSMGWPACISHVNSVGAVYDENFGTVSFCVQEASLNSCAVKIPTTSCSTGYQWSDATAPDKVTTYSNSAMFLTLFAPSHNAYTSDITGSGGYTTGDYTTSFGGTSAACPYAAGAAAVLQHAAKTLTGSYLSPAQVKSYLTTYGDNITDGKVAVTKPRINLAASVAQLPGTNLTLTGVSINGPTSVNENTTTTYTATASWSNGSTSTVTPSWSEDSDYATISAAGVLSASLVPSNQSVIITASYTSGGITKADTHTVTIIDILSISLGDALDNTSLSWSTGGNTSWFGQTVTHYYDGDAGQSGDISDSQQSYFETTVSGPGTINFYWQVSSEGDYDWLYFSIDGTEQSGRISGINSWASKSYDIPAGSHILRWTYIKDYSISSGSDCGWVDKVVWTPTAATLTGLTISGPATVNENSTATYTATAGWSDGSTSTVTPNWAEDSAYTTISTTGVLTASSVTADQTVTITASYTSGGVTKTDTHSVTVVNIPLALTGLTIDGPDTVNENNTATYTATASWNDGTTSTVTPSWTEDSSYATISAAGLLSASSVPSNQSFIITASYTNGGVTKVDTHTVTIIDSPSISLGDALDNTSLSWSTGGNASWFGQTATSYYGGDAGQSGDILDDQQSYFETTVSGPGTINFYWQVSSESGYDYLCFSIDGSTQSGCISGTNSWASKSFAIKEGSHILKWTYSKDTSESSGSDCGWVDKVVWTPTATTLIGLKITGPDAVNENSTATFTATASWSDGTKSTVTPSWTEDSSYTTISTTGILTVSSVTADQSVTISASFTSGGLTKTDTHSVLLANRRANTGAILLLLE
jgi:subtilisin family serine protease